MHTEFQKILDQVQAKAPAARTFEAEGTTYIRNFRPNERLILLGCGHIAQPVCRYAADLGFSVTVADDRPSFANHTRFPEAEQVICDSFPNAIRQIQVNERDYVAVITRGHRYDADCLREILPGTFPRYLGMIGSRRRVIGLLNLLEEEGFSREALDKIHTPIGVDIGASSVMENAVGGGALMAVDQALRMAGTIGGGCSEYAVLMDAYRIIGTGAKRCVTIDMSNDVAEEEGMVCGGQMKVMIEDIPEKG